MSATVCVLASLEEPVAKPFHVDTSKEVTRRYQLDQMLDCEHGCVVQKVCPDSTLLQPEPDFRISCSHPG